MPARTRSQRRYRFMVWLDESGQPLQGAIATYVDDDVLREHTWNVEPFDTVMDVYREALAAVDIQLPLWQDRT